MQIQFKATPTTFPRLFTIIRISKHLIPGHHHAEDGEAQDHKFFENGFFHRKKFKMLKPQWFRFFGCPF
jgi:hypothetical protein